MANWSGVLEQIKAISSDIYATVNPPASPSEIRELEEAMGVEFPWGFRDYLSTMNGQRNTEEAVRDRNSEIPLLGYHPFLSVAAILETWRMMNELFGDGGPPLEWAEEDKIKPFVWRRRWLPFTEFEGSQYLILDCDPGKNGTYGQVFLWSSGMDFKTVTADSFEEFAAGLYDRLAAGKFEVSEFGTIEFTDYYI